MTVFNLENEEENIIGVGPNVYVRACMTIPHRDITIYDILTTNDGVMSDIAFLLRNWTFRLFVGSSKLDRSKGFSKWIF